MKEALIKLQIESLEQKLQVLKSKIVSSKRGRSLSDLYGIFEGKMDIYLEEIKKYEYSYENRV
jgi:hypothetical protein